MHVKSERGHASYLPLYRASKERVLVSFDQSNNLAQFFDSYAYCKNEVVCSALSLVKTLMEKDGNVGTRTRRVVATLLLLWVLGTLSGRAEKACKNKPREQHSANPSIRLPLPLLFLTAFTWNLPSSSQCIHPNAQYILKTQQVSRERIASQDYPYARP